MIKCGGVLLLLFAASTLSISQAKEEPAKYDSVLAKKLGADQYGMKKYIMAFLKSGKTEIKDSVEMAKLQNAHLKNIIRMEEEGALVLAGPFFGGKDIRGIYVFNVQTVEEARKLTESDPMIIQGVLEMDLRPWYCSAALMEIPRIHKMIEKKSVAE